MVYICYIIENYRECRNIIGYTEKGGFPSIFFPACNMLFGPVEINWQNLKKKNPSWSYQAVLILKFPFLSRKCE